MFKIWRNRFFISYLPVFLVVMLSISISFFLFVNYSSQQQAKRANRLFVDQMILKLDQTLQQIDSVIMREVTFNERLNAFFGHDRRDVFSGVAEPSRVLQELLSLAPEIDNLYLYDQQDQTVLSKNSLFSLQQFGDREFVKEAADKGGALRWLPARSFREFPDDSPKQVITLVRKVPILTGEKGLIVVNIDTETIRRKIRELSGNSLSEVSVRDQGGSFLLHPSSSPALTSKLATYNSAYTGWEYAVVLKDAGMFRVFSTLQVIWVGITLVLFLLGIVWIIYVSRNQYKPVEAILQQIRAFTPVIHPQSAGWAGDEFSFIQTAIGRMIEQSNEYHEKHKEGQIYRRRQFFHELTEGPAAVGASPSHWAEEWRELQLPGDYSSLCACIIEMDKYVEFEEQYSPSDRNLFKFVLRSVSVELAEKRGLAAWPEWVGSDRLAVLWFSLANDAAPIGDLCQELVAWVDGHLHFTVTVGMGMPVRRLEEVAASYTVAEKALKYKSVLGTNRFIDPENIGNANSQKVYDSLEEVKETAQLYVQGDPRWMDAFHHLMNGLQSRLLSGDDIRVAMEYVRYHINLSMRELAPEYREIWDRRVYPSLPSVMERGETLEEVRWRYAELLDEAFRHMEAERESRSSYSLILRVREFIGRHYSSPDLSLAYIGEHFGLNIKSLSQMFKEELGEKFVDYVARLRIEEAKRLLQETELPVQDVAVRVGYLSVHTFNRVFKKQMNVTPGDYRKQHS